MIHDKTARCMGVKFLKEQKLNQYATELETRRYCLYDLFTALVDKLGKARVHTLYLYLPKQLKYYVLSRVSHPEFVSKLRDIDWKYNREWDSRRPERLKNFQAYMQELQEVVLKFLAS